MFKFSLNEFRVCSSRSVVLLIKKFPNKIFEMNQGPVSCLPVNPKMSKAKKVLDEARELKIQELDLVDRNISTFDELSGLRKFFFSVK